LEDLDRRTLPCIAHTRSEYLRRDNQSGHYLVVLKADGERIQVVDGTCGDVLRLPPSKISGIWTGYVLEPRSVQQAWTEVITLNGVGLLAVLGVALLASHRRSPAGAPKLGAGLLLIACWSASGATPVAASEPSAGARDGPGEWRTAANDAVNCLYLQLAILGHPVDYARVREAVFAKGGAVSMVTLREAAGRCGLPMKLVRCGPDELKRMPKPAIVYVHDTRSGGGFALLYSLNDERCGLVSGVAYILQEEVDKFRRDWSGFALVPEPPGDGWLSAIAASLVLIAGYSGWRLRLGA
jgi:ABC-type bacteriocin/lantibiotic exporter with double-glycine peptidase domain